MALDNKQIINYESLLKVLDYIDERDSSQAVFWKDAVEDIKKVADRSVTTAMNVNEMTALVDGTTYTFFGMIPHVTDNSSGNPVFEGYVTAKYVNDVGAEVVSQRNIRAEYNGTAYEVVSVKDFAGEVEETACAVNKTLPMADIRDAVDNSYTAFMDLDGFEVELDGVTYKLEGSVPFTHKSHGYPEFRGRGTATNKTDILETKPVDVTVIWNEDAMPPYWTASATESTVVETSSAVTKQSTPIEVADLVASSKLVLMNLAGMTFEDADGATYALTGAIPYSGNDGGNKHKFSGRAVRIPAAGTIPTATTGGVRVTVQYDETSTLSNKWVVKEFIKEDASNVVFVDETNTYAQVAEYLDNGITPIVKVEGYEVDYGAYKKTYSGHLEYYQIENSTPEKARVEFRGILAENDSREMYRASAMYEVNQPYRLNIDPNNDKIPFDALKYVRIDVIEHTDGTYDCYISDRDPALPDATLEDVWSRLDNSENNHAVWIYYRKDGESNECIFQYTGKERFEKEVSGTPHEFVVQSGIDGTHILKVILENDYAGNVTYSIDVVEVGGGAETANGVRYTDSYNDVKEAIESANVTHMNVNGLDSGLQYKDDAGNLQSLYLEGELPLISIGTPRYRFGGITYAINGALEDSTRTKVSTTVEYDGNEWKAYCRRLKDEFEETACGVTKDMSLDEVHEVVEHAKDIIMNVNGLTWTDYEDVMHPITYTIYGAIPYIDGHLSTQDKFGGHVQTIDPNGKKAWADIEVVWNTNRWEVVSCLFDDDEITYVIKVKVLTEAEYGDHAQYIADVVAGERLCTLVEPATLDEIWTELYKHAEKDNPYASGYGDGKLSDGRFKVKMVVDDRDAMFTSGRCELGAHIVGLQYHAWMSSCSAMVPSFADTGRYMNFPFQTGAKLGNEPDFRDYVVYVDHKYDSNFKIRRQNRDLEDYNLTVSKTYDAYDVPTYSVVNGDSGATFKQIFDSAHDGDHRITVHVVGDGGNEDKYTANAVAIAMQDDMKAGRQRVRLFTQFGERIRFGAKGEVEEFGILEISRNKTDLAYSATYAPTYAPVLEAKAKIVRFKLVGSNWILDADNSDLKNYQEIVSARAKGEPIFAYDGYDTYYLNRCNSATGDTIQFICSSLQKEDDGTYTPKFKYIESDRNGSMVYYRGDKVLAGGSGGSVTWNNVENKPFDSVDTAISATSTNPVQNKAIYTALDDKVSKETGKGLSTNDYDNDAKAEVAKIADKADADDVYTKTESDNTFVKKTDVKTAVVTGDTQNPVSSKAVEDYAVKKEDEDYKNVQADWNQTNTAKWDFIKNKPEVYTQDEIDEFLDDIYTKTEVDTKLGDYYKKTEVNTELAKKVDKTADDYLTKAELITDGIKITPNKGSAIEYKLEDYVEKAEMTSENLVKITQHDGTTVEQKPYLAKVETIQVDGLDEYKITDNKGVETKLDVYKRADTFSRDEDAVPTDLTTYGKKQIDDMIKALEGVTMKVVATVPAPADATAGTIYICDGTMYLCYKNGEGESAPKVISPIGGTAPDLTQYWKKTDGDLMSTAEHTKLTQDYTKAELDAKFADTYVKSETYSSDEVDDLLEDYVKTTDDYVVKVVKADEKYTFTQKNLAEVVIDITPATDADVTSLLDSIFTE